MRTCGELLYPAFDSWSRSQLRLVCKAGRDAVDPNVRCILLRDRSPFLEDCNLPEPPPFADVGARWPNA